MTNWLTYWPINCPNNWQTYQPTNQPTNQPPNLPMHPPTYLPTYPPTYQPNKQTTKQPSAWSRNPWESNVLQLVKKFCAFYGMWNFITVFTRACYFTLSSAKLIQPLPTHHSFLKSPTTPSSITCAIICQWIKWQTLAE